MGNRTLTWVETANPLTLSARIYYLDIIAGAHDHDLEGVQEWCRKNNCGKRMSFDQFKFKSHAEITLFLLKWNNVELLDI